MPAPEVTRLPEHIYDGETIVVFLTVPDYLPDDGWTVKMGGSSADGVTQLTTLIATDNTDGRHKLTITAAATAEIGADPGDWRYQLRAEHSTSGKRVVEVGRFEGHPDFQDAAADDRTHAEATLAALEVTILGKASKDQLAYTINGRSLSRMSPAELREWRDSYRAEVAEIIAKEDTAQGRADGSRILARM